MSSNGKPLDHQETEGTDMRKEDSINTNVIAIGGAYNAAPNYNMKDVRNGIMVAEIGTKIAELLEKDKSNIIIFPIESKLGPCTAKAVNWIKDEFIESMNIRIRIDAKSEDWLDRLKKDERYDNEAIDILEKAGVNADEIYIPSLADKRQKGGNRVHLEANIMARYANKVICIYPDIENAAGRPALWQAAYRWGCEIHEIDSENYTHNTVPGNKDKKTYLEHTWQIFKAAEKAEAAGNPPQIYGSIAGDCEENYEREE